MNTDRSRLVRCKGAVLLLVMVFMLLLALLTGTSMQASIVQVRMANNEFFYEEAFQSALAIVDAIGSELDNFSLHGTVGHTLCQSTNSATYCDSEHTIDIDPRIEGFSPDTEIGFEVERIAPRYLPSLPIRQAQHSVSSSLAYDAAIFEIHAIVDGRNRGLGFASATRGVALLVPNSSGSSAE
jgi:hypothetical protein